MSFLGPPAALWPWDAQLNVLKKLRLLVAGWTDRVGFPLLREGHQEPNSTSPRSFMSSQSARSGVRAPWRGVFCSGSHAVRPGCRPGTPFLEAQGKSALLTRAGCRWKAVARTCRAEGPRSQRTRPCLAM